MQSGEEDRCCLLWMPSCSHGFLATRFSFEKMFDLNLLVDLFNLFSGRKKDLTVFAWTKLLLLLTCDHLSEGFVL
jgi:hypothetical protein